jgi:hypothetical protein
MPMPSKTKKYAAWAALAFVLAIQFIRPERTNPPVDPAATFEAVAKPDPQLAAIVRRACRDCHSHDTKWPWYSLIAPVSWLVADDVEQGRAHLNFSRWNLLSPEMSKLRMKEACREVRSKGMPPWQYRLMHPEARIGDEDVAMFCDAVDRMP